MKTKVRKKPCGARVEYVANILGWDVPRVARCTRVEGHPPPHRSADRYEWTDDDPPPVSPSKRAA